ncbi:hypothetical protein [Tritonibacter scottomollicae]|uniref:hypothetical protein n=1 Tax=Tritonibacter scottomollicae TaxID=483013 RepID=UPI003AA9C0FE
MIRFEGLKDIPTTPQAWAGYALGRQMKMFRSVAALTAEAPQRQLHLTQALLKMQQEWISGLPGSLSTVTKAVSAPAATQSSRQASATVAAPSQTAPADVTAPATTKPRAKKAAAPRKAPARKSASATKSGVRKTAPAAKTSSAKGAASATAAAAKPASVKSAPAPSAKPAARKPVAVKPAPKAEASVAMNTKSVSSSKQKAPEGALAERPASGNGAATNAVQHDARAPEHGAKPPRRRPRAPATPPVMPEASAGKGGTNDES